METRDAIRNDQWLAACQVAPEIFDQVMPRLSTFMDPFVETFQGQALTQHAKTYVSGLLSDVERKNVESIAYHVGQNRLGLQGFIGWADWDDAPLRQTLLAQVGQQLGQGDGVLVFDPSAFPKSGRESVGVARQWCGRLGKVDNCQVAIYLGYVSAHGHTLVDLRLYLPKAWTQDKARLHKAGVPKASQRYRTRHQLALDMLEKHGAGLPHAWIAGDDEMGRPYWFRRRLAGLGEQYLLAVPSNTLIRDLETAPPVPRGRGRKPQRPWQSVAQWSQALSDDAWKRIDVRDGAKGPLVVEVVKRRVVSRTYRRQQGHEEVVVVMRYRDRDNAQVVKVDYYLSNAASETPLWQFARVAKAEHRIEDCIQRSKSEAGLADYEVRHWTGWQHHQTLSLLATWFLVQETERGKKKDPSDDVTPDSPRHRGDLARGLSVRHESASAGHVPEALATQ
ncbi:MAG TPA: IS701 family transposase [Candidatus Tectomicrobia bacterium]|nr:IS701 family transposase [Candidatus Tectomicrobia bacterium]